MGEIPVARVRDAVAALYVEANRRLPPDIEALLRSAAETERNERARRILRDLCENIDAAAEMRLPICQDTGMAVIFADIGQDVRFTGGLFEDAVQEGVRLATKEGLLRASVAVDPLRRGNTGDNTPAVLHIRLMAGDELALTVAPKGCGSENMSALYMLEPSVGREDIVAKVADTARRAGGNACPPMVIGVGLGGNFEHAALLAKRALCRPADAPHPDLFYRELEREMLAAVNATGVGPAGFGGDTTALAVQIESAPTHIAGLPMAVNIGCHATRHKSLVIRPREICNSYFRLRIN